MPAASHPFRSHVSTISWSALSLSCRRWGGGSVRGQHTALRSSLSRYSRRLVDTRWCHTLAAMYLCDISQCDHLSRVSLSFSVCLYVSLVVGGDGVLVYVQVLSMCPNTDLQSFLSKYSAVCVCMYWCGCFNMTKRNSVSLCLIFVFFLVFCITYY